jgi:hypothetical protein
MSKRDVFAAVLVALFCAIYGLSLVPGIGMTGDSIKFQYVGRVLGVPHATGYPLYLLLNHLFTAIPVESVAFRANLMSAGFAVLALVFLYLALCRLTARPAASFVGAAFFGLTATFWSQAIVAEVYTLAAFSLAFILWSLLEWQATKKFGYFAAFLLAYGLSLGNHLTILACFPAALVFVLTARPKILTSVKAWMLGLAALALGLGQYGLLFLRTARAAPYLEHEVRTVQDLARVMSGRQFQGQMFAFSPKEIFLDRVPLLFRMLAHDITWPVLVLALAGFVFLFLRARKAFLLVGLAFLGETLWVLSTDIRDLQSHLIPVSLACCLAAGFGLNCLASLLRKRTPPLLPLALLPLLAWLAAANLGRVSPAGLPAYASRLETDRSLAALFDNIPAHSVVLTDEYGDAQNVHYKRLIDFPGKKVIPHLLSPNEPVAVQLTTKLVVSLQTNPSLQRAVGLEDDMRSWSGLSREAVGFKLMRLLRADPLVRRGFATRVYFFSEGVKETMEAQGVPFEPWAARASSGGRKFLFYRIRLFDAP